MKGEYDSPFGKYLQRKSTSSIPILDTSSEISSYLLGSTAGTKFREKLPSSKSFLKHSSRMQEENSKRNEWDYLGFSFQKTNSVGSVLSASSTSLSTLNSYIDHQATELFLPPYCKTSWSKAANKSQKQTKKHGIEVPLCFLSSETFKKPSAVDTKRLLNMQTIEQALEMKLLNKKKSKKLVATKILKRNDNLWGGSNLYSKKRSSQKANIYGKSSTCSMINGSALVLYERPSNFSKCSTIMNDEVFTADSLGSFWNPSMESMEENFHHQSSKFLIEKKFLSAYDHVISAPLYFPIGYQLCQHFVKPPSFCPRKRRRFHSRVVPKAYLCNG